AGEGDATQAPLGVRPDDAKARGGGGGGSYRAATARVGGPVRTGGDDPSEGGPELGIADAPHVPPGRPTRGDRAQAPDVIIVVLAQVFFGKGSEQAGWGARQGSLFGEDLTERSGLIQDPGVHPGNQGVARSQAHARRQDPEEQVALCVRPP